jgi:hypothetical protein
MPPDLEDDSRTIREDLIAAFADTDKTESTPGSEPNKVSTETPQKTDSSSVANPDGGKTVADKTAKPAVAPVAGDKPASGEPAVSKPLDPPARWTKTQKEWFTALTPEFQKQLLDNDKNIQADYTKKTTELAQERMRYADVEKVMAPRRDQFARQGLNDGAALNMIMSYWDLAQKNPAGFIQQFAQERGLDLGSMYAQPAAPNSGQPVRLPDGMELHPVVVEQLQYLQTRLDKAERALSSHGNVLQSREAATQAEQVSSAAAELKAFESATNEQGQPLYPFLTDVRQDMARLWQAGLVGDLKSAYDMAVRVRPDVFSKVQESRDIARAREDEARRAAEADRAKRAGASVTPSSVGSMDTPRPTRELSLRDEIRAAFDAQSAGSQI